MLEQLSYLADIVGVVAIVVSLLYVGRQLKQTNAMSRSGFRQTMSITLNDWAMTIANSPELCLSLSKIQFHGKVRDDMTELERIHLGYTYYALINQIHMAYEHWKEGLLTDNELSEVMGSKSPLIAAPYLVSVWPILEPPYPTDFQQWFERYLTKYHPNRTDA